MAAGSVGAISMFRNLPMTDGASGQLLANNPDSNMITDASSVLVYTVFPVDFTTQRYLNFTVAPTNIGAVVRANAIIVEFIHETP
jgi:hypothetical protein